MSICEENRICSCYSPEIIVITTTINLAFMNRVHLVCGVFSMVTWSVVYSCFMFFTSPHVRLPHLQKSFYLYNIQNMLQSMIFFNSFSFWSPPIDIHSDPFCKPIDIFVPDKRHFPFLQQLNQPPRMCFTMRDEPGNRSLTSFSFGKSLTSKIPFSKEVQTS